jgi:pimeloyl-ACP methyl ester carboxylesterase
MNWCRTSQEAMMSEEQAEFEKLVKLERLENDGRVILYGVGGDPEGSPILFFPPLSGTRHMIPFMHDHLTQHSLKAICVNRPTTEGSSPSQSVQDHVDKACSDVVAVLDSLQIEKAGILCMCAGAPFALAFCTRYPDRTTGKFVGLAPWALPADCPHSKSLHKFAANYLPLLPVSYLVSTMESTMMSLFSKETIAKKIREKSSEEERKYLDQKYNESSSGKNFGQEFDWMMGQHGGNTYDVAVSLSTSKTLGIDYEKIPGIVAFWQGDNDQMAPIPVSEWLTKQIPSATLNVILKGTHGGALFMLSPEIVESLESLR